MATSSFRLTFSSLLTPGGECISFSIVTVKDLGHISWPRLGHLPIPELITLTLIAPNSRVELGERGSPPEKVLAVGLLSS